METLTAPPPAAPSNANPTPAEQPGMSADSINHLESLFNEPAPEKPAETLNQPPAQKPPEQKAPEKPVQKAPEKPAEKQPEKKPEPAKKEGEAELKGAAQLRKAYEDLKAENTRLSKLLEEKSKPVEDPEKAQWKSRYDELEKRFNDTDGELRFARYEKSHEYREKYEKPMHKAMQDAERDIGELVVTDGDGNERKATIQDFAALVDMPLQKAISQAKSWFGDAATEVLAHRRKLVDLSKSAKEAVDDYKKRGSEMEKQKATDEEKQQAQIASNWEGINKYLRTNKADLFGPVESDKEGNELLDKWTQFADLALNPKSDLPVEKRIQYLALVRNKAAAFDRLLLFKKRSDEKAAALENELQAFKSSVPGGGSSSKKQEGAPTWKTADQALEELAVAR